MNCVERFKELCLEKKVDVWNTLCKCIGGEKIFKNSADSYRQICKEFFNNDAFAMLDILEYCSLDDNANYIVVFVGYSKEWHITGLDGEQLLDFVIYDRYNDDELRDMLLKYWKVRKAYPELYVDEEE